MVGITSSATVRQRSMSYLNEPRQFRTKRVSRLKGRAASSTNGKQKMELSSRAAEIALPDTSTFDVKEKFLDDVLLHHSKISTLLRYSTVVQENQDTIRPECQSYLAVMIQV